MVLLQAQQRPVYVYAAEGAADAGSRPLSRLRIMHMFVAQLACHHEWLSASLPAGHPPFPPRRCSRGWLHSARTASAHHQGGLQANRTMKLTGLWQEIDGRKVKVQENERVMGVQMLKDC
eukprot:TRINITY_DN1859_c0_g1_i1.p1 TRINITY_DN1859_c0_g1~~TRINITY_DN1859_c0_g1_i1.p1  ORF type:complete len:120 (-),score=8.01 TRINITY_DN1859_c0_g1_i1:373-732(-)